MFKIKLFYSVGTGLENMAKTTNGSLYLVFLKEAARPDEFCKYFIDGENNLVVLHNQINRQCKNINMILVDVFVKLLLPLSK